MCLTPAKISHALYTTLHRDFELYVYFESIVTWFLSLCELLRKSVRSTDGGCLQLLRRCCLVLFGKYHTIGSMRTHSHVSFLLNVVKDLSLNINESSSFNEFIDIG
jgi:hypothetical protein